MSKSNLGVMILKAALLSVVLVALLNLTGAHYEKKRYRSMVYKDSSNDDVMELNAVSIRKVLGPPRSTHKKEI